MAPTPAAPDRAAGHLLLVVDRRFIRLGGQFFTEGPRGSETGEPYLPVFETVTVAGREGSPQADRARLNLLDDPRRTVVTLPNLSGLRARMCNLGSARQALFDLIERADCVIARLHTELGLEAVHLAVASGKPVAVDLGGCVLDDLRWHGSLAGKLYAPFAYRRNQRAVRAAGWVAYVTQQFLQQRYPAAPGARVVAFSDVDIPEADEAVLQRRLARIGAMVGRPLVLGTIGSLHGQFKGIQHAIPALAALRHRLPPLRYRILGGGDAGPWRALAQRHGVADLVDFDGVLPAGEPVRRWLDEIDVYLQPSLREGLPRALIEAMSRGCPALASGIAGIPELLGTECLHPPADPRAVGDRLEDLLRQGRLDEHARRNWQTAARYTRPAVEEARGGFWWAFRDAALRQAGHHGQAMDTA